MSHRVTIDFTGLCVFATKNVPERLSVLLAADTKGMMRHRPILSFDVRNFGSYSGGSVSQVIQMPDGTQVASWSLDRSLVTLKAGPSARPERVVLCGGGAPRARCPQDPVAEMDLCWVPSLKRISGEGDIDPVYLSDHPVPKGAHKSPLAARFDLTAGYLFCNAGVNRQSPSAYWTFAGGTEKPTSQYLADTVRLEIQAATNDPLVFAATPFGGKDTQTLELRPWNDRIAISITNLPDMLPMQDMPLTTMPHFSLYYELLKNAPRHKPVPTTAEECTCGPAPKTAAVRAMAAVPALGVYPVKCTPSISP